MSKYLDELQARNYLWMSPRLRQLIEGTILMLIGCGGNGVTFTINAAHLGFRHFVLCDHDHLTETNLNRHIIALPSQIGMPKVEIIRDYLTERFPNIQVSCIRQKFPNKEILIAIPYATLVIGCLDAEYTRLHLDVLCRKYRRTLIDLGSGFIVNNTDDSRIVTDAGGQVFISRPLGACLRCLGFDNGVPNNYFVTAGTPEPSSLLINQIVSALAVECVLNELLDQLAPINAVEYDRRTFFVKRDAIAGKENCQICGSNSAEHLASVAEQATLLSALEIAGIICKIA